MNSMTFLQAGPMTTIQDLGRYGWQDKGVSVSGVMDEFATRLANRLVGNLDDAPVIEMTLMSDRIRFESASVIALTGVDMQFCINGRQVQRNEVLYVCQGDVLSGSVATQLFAKNNISVRGARAYIAVAGTLECDNVFGSYSTDLKGGFGGISGSKIKTGDSIYWTLKASQHIEEQQVGLPRATKMAVPDSVLENWYADRKVRLCLSQEVDRFEKGSVELIQQGAYKVTGESDRMGYRLSGTPLKHTKGCDILSSPLTKGSIQIPKDGQPIVMMSDRQTTGGYTKIGQVIKADLPYLAQRKPGDLISFEVITPEEAIELYKKRMSELDEHIGRAEVFTEEYSGSRDFAVSVNGRSYRVNVMEKT